MAVNRYMTTGHMIDCVVQLEDSLQASAQDLKYASTTLQADLDRFQRQKVADLRQLTIQLAKVHREWCRQVGFYLSSHQIGREFGLLSWLA